MDFYQDGGPRARSLSQGGGLLGTEADGDRDKRRETESGTGPGVGVQVGGTRGGRSAQPAGTSSCPLGGRGAGPTPRDQGPWSRAPCGAAAQGPEGLWEAPRSSRLQLTTDRSCTGILAVSLCPSRYILFIRRGRNDLGRSWSSACAVGRGPFTSCTQALGCSPAAANIHPRQTLSPHAWQPTALSRTPLSARLWGQEDRPGQATSGPGKFTSQGQML